MVREVEDALQVKRTNGLLEARPTKHRPWVTMSLYGLRLKVGTLTPWQLRVFASNHPLAPRSIQKQSE